MAKGKILVSACLLGANCKYSGGNNIINESLIHYLKENYSIVQVCPEELGGLTTPREPCEIVEGKVLTKTLKDVTKEFNNGAIKVLNIAKENNIKLAILKSNSPSCGNKKIYDGTFSSNLIDGKGVTAELLVKNGIEVINEEEFKKRL